MTSELPWVRAGSLVDFLDYLRTQGFRITVNEYAATHELIVALIDRGIDVRDENVLKSYLGPVLCVSPRDQAAFPSHFDRWVTRRVPEQVVRRPVESELEHEGRKWRSWQWILALISVALVSIAGSKPTALRR